MAHDDLRIKNDSVLARQISDSQEEFVPPGLKCIETCRSHFWPGLMTSKKYLFHFGSFAIKDGSEILFWEDRWLGNASLRE